MNKPSVLITGANGYLARRISRLLESQYTIYKIVRRSETKEDFESGDPNLWSRLDKISPALIIHAATNYGRSSEPKEQIFKDNLDFPKQLFEWAIRKGVKQFLNIDTSLPKEVSIYSESKSEFREVLRKASEQMQVINCQLEHFYGPGANSKNFVIFLAQNFLKKIPHLPLSEGRQIRDFIFIEDAVRAIDLVIKSASDESRFFSVPIGSGKGIAIRDLVELTQKLCGNSETSLGFGELPLRPNEPKTLVSDTQWLQSRGFRTRIPIEEGLRKVIEYERRILTG